MKPREESNPISLDYLGLDNCKNDAERAAILWSDIMRRNSELKQVRKAYQKVYHSILGQWKDELSTRFQNLSWVSHAPSADLAVEFTVGNIYYKVGIGKDQHNLICIVLLDLQDIHKGIFMSDEFVSNINSILSQKRGCPDIYCLYDTFDINDYEKAFKCFTALIEKSVDLARSDLNPTRYD